MLFRYIKLHSNWKVERPNIGWSLAELLASLKIDLTWLKMETSVGLPESVDVCIAGYAASHAAPRKPTGKRAQFQASAALRQYRHITNNPQRRRAPRSYRQQLSADSAGLPTTPPLLVQWGGQE